MPASPGDHCSGIRARCRWRAPFGPRGPRLPIEFSRVSPRRAGHAGGRPECAAAADLLVRMLDVANLDEAIEALGIREKIAPRCASGTIGSGCRRGTRTPREAGETAAGGPRWRSRDGSPGRRSTRSSGRRCPLARARWKASIRPSLDSLLSHLEIASPGRRERAQRNIFAAHRRRCARSTGRASKSRVRLVSD